MEVRKAVIPAAGLGTRFLPLTKALPKELLPLADKPLIQHIVEEAAASGIEQVIVVTAPGKEAIEGHFCRNHALEAALERKGEVELLGEVRRCASLADMHFVTQEEPLGLGHAVLTAKGAVGDEPFAVLLPDDIFDADPPLLKQMMEVYKRYGGSVLALKRVSRDDISRYGIAETETLEDGAHRVLSLVEKPAAEEAPSDLAIMGRYILDPDIFAALEATTPGAIGEIQLTDAMSRLLQERSIYGYEFSGDYHDAGKPLGLLKATVTLGLRHPAMGSEFREYLKRLFERA